MTRWTTGAAAVLSLVPLTVWAVTAAGSLGSLLSLALFVSARPA